MSDHEHIREYEVGGENIYEVPIYFTAPEGIARATCRAWLVKNFKDIPRQLHTAVAHSAFYGVASMDTNVPVVLGAELLSVSSDGRTATLKAVSKGEFKPEHKDSLKACPNAIQVIFKATYPSGHPRKGVLDVQGSLIRPTIRGYPFFNRLKPNKEKVAPSPELVEWTNQQKLMLAYILEENTY